MTTVTPKGSPVPVAGMLPEIGQGNSDFNLTGEDLGYVSLFRGRDFRVKYGVDIADGPLKGLTTRAVVWDEQNRMLPLELIPKIANEPSYKAAPAAL